MKNNKIILVSVITWSVMAVVLATPAAATQNTLYFIPDSGSLPGYGESIDIDLMADINEANPVIATSVNITFDPNCVELTNWTLDGGWNSGMDSSAWSIPFGFITISTSAGSNPAVIGGVPMGTLTLHCNSTANCETCLKFSTGEYTTEEMETLYPTLNDGMFSCASPPASGDDGEQGGEEGDSGGGITTTPSPTHSPSLTASPIPDTTPTPTPAVSPTVTPVATSNPTPASSPEEMRTPASPGFGLIISVGMLVTAVYLIRKRGGR